MPEDPTLENTQLQLITRLQAEYAGIVERYPFERYVTALNERHSFMGYFAVDERVSAMCSGLIRTYSSDALDMYHRCLLLYLLILHRHKMLSGHYAATVQEQFQRECRRIAQEVECNPVGFYDYSNDLFCKDLGVATLRMFPAGSLKVESMAGIPRRIIFSNNGRDLIRWLKHIQCFGGFNPYYEIHLDIRYRDDFIPNGWERALRIVGEMLILHPHIKGITGASWFFDPQISTITPRLAYLRQGIEENGGRFFHFKKDEHTTELAISSSPTRRQLYKEGSYLPVSYFMVWPRKEILQWVKRGVSLHG